jgi:hypothetical protein
MRYNAGMTYAEIIAREIHAAGWSYGEAKAIEDGGPVWIVDAKRIIPRDWLQSLPTSWLPIKNCCD